MTLKRLGAIAALLMVVGVALLLLWPNPEVEPPLTVRDMSLRPLHAGCYEISVGRWVPGFQPGHSIAHVAGRYQLDTALGRFERGQDGSSHWEHGEALIRPGWFPGSAYWIPVDSHTVRLMWNTGFYGVRALIRRTADGYEGRARAHTDVVTGLPQPTTRMVARPIDCALVPPDTVRAAGARTRWWEAQRRAYDSVRKAKGR